MRFSGPNLAGSGPEPSGLGFDPPTRFGSIAASRQPNARGAVQVRQMDLLHALVEVFAKSKAVPRDGARSEDGGRGEMQAGAGGCKRSRKTVGVQK